ncbi:cation/H+ exchanger protein 1 isoform X2 [Paralichthys olivaceus]|uniref:cation/H+ exchanger protein 1 isoform X2 n=1 Tax=Paralichthys olivaceus TaxID=8255 RepID=UPI00097DDD38|nr:PREDICTED: low affinity vacuolar monovalent cation/H(+) antiporter-like isoform X2 [Paralichthys olivaceus]
MSDRKTSSVPDDADSLRRRSAAQDSSEIYVDPEQHRRFPRRQSQTDRLCVGPQHPELGTMATPSPDGSGAHFYHYTPKCFLTIHRGHGTSARSTPSQNGEEGWHDATTKTTIRAENEVEAHREANNYRFGFRKWKGNVTEKPIGERSDITKELYTDLSVVRPQEGLAVSFGNIIYVFLFGWWISLIYFLICPIMFLTIFGAPYGKLCWKLALYFIWPFEKSIEKANDAMKSSILKPPKCDVIPEEGDTEDSKDMIRDKDSAPLLVSSPISLEIPVPEPPVRKASKHWCRVSTYVWLLLGYPVLAVAHSVACVLSWLLIFTIPVAKMNARTLSTVLLMAPEDVQIQRQEKKSSCEIRVVLYCYQASNVHYCKYTVQGINIFALNLLPLVLITLIVGYTDPDHNYFSAETKFATAITSIIPLSYYIGMGIASISAQSNFAVGAVVNATFGSITEMTFYITALLQGYHANNKCYEEIVKAALTGTLLGCILFIPGICMIIGGIKHREQRFNSRSAGVSSALLFISVGGVFAPTLFSKTFGYLVCESCTNIPNNTSVPFICKDCHYDTSRTDPHLILSHIEPLVYTISVLLPAAYLIGLIFTLKTHSHIYDIHISDGHGGHAHGQYKQEDAITCHPTGGHHVVHWSRWRALAVLIVATVLMACCADLSTENVKPILTNSSISKYFIGVTVLAMVPELPEIVNGIQFALQNNISLSLEVGSCIAIQVCMIQIPLLILFNAFYDVGFVLVFSDIHLWASIFSVILVNYIFMDGKCDYFQGTALVVVYLILLALYFFAPSPRSC